MSRQLNATLFYCCLAATMVILTVLAFPPDSPAAEREAPFQAGNEFFGTALVDPGGSFGAYYESFEANETYLNRSHIVLDGILPARQTVADVTVTAIEAGMRIEFPQGTIELFPFSEAVADLFTGAFGQSATEPSVQVIVRPWRTPGHTEIVFLQPR